MPLMREFGSLQRKRLSEGVTPLEHQRWLDLGHQIGKNFGRARVETGCTRGDTSDRDQRSRLLVSYRSKAELLEALIENIQPAGFFVSTPFAAAAGSEFIVRITVETEGDIADVPATVVTSMVDGAHTLSTMSMGMGLKIERPTREQAVGISKLFDRVLDVKLGIADRV